LVGTKAISGVQYYSYYNYLSHADLVGRVKTIKFAVTYDINGDGVIADNEKDIFLQDTINMNAIDYASAVINNYPHGSDASNLMYEMIRYEEIFAKYVNANISTVEDKIQAFYAAYRAKCNCEGDSCPNMIDLDKLEIEHRDSSVADLSKYIYGASFSISTSNSKPRLVLYGLPLAEGCSLSVKGSYKKYESNGTLVDSELNIGTAASYGSYNATINGETVKCSIYRINGFDFAYMTDEISITVTHTDASGNVDVVSGTYSLGSYISANGDLEVVRALYAFSLAAKDYRLITKDEVAGK
jgi:hypothetical protein